MLEFVAFAVAFVVFLVISVIYLMPSNKKITTVPGPTPVDTLEGNFPDIQASGSLHEFLTSLHETYGPIASLWWGPRLTVSIASPQLFKEHAKVFDRPPELFELFEPLIGRQSLQLTNGGEGRRRHSAYAKCFTEDVINQYYKTFHKLSTELVSKWASLPANDHVPLRQYMMAYSIKSVLQGNVGDYFNDDKEIIKIRKAYDFTWHEMENRLRGDIPELSTERIDRFDKQKAILRDIMKKCISERQARSPAAGQYLVIDAIMDQNEDEETRISDCITVLIGGFHTTGLLLTWAMYYLASHKEVQDQLQQEIKLVLGEDKVSPDNIKDLRYLKQVLDETLRCSVLAPMAARVQEIDTELGGHRIPAHTPVIHALGVMLQDPDLYPDPEMFDPDRFTDEAKKGRPGYSFEPFGFSGKRKCLGYRFGEIEATVALAEIIRTFQVDLVEGQVVVPEYGLVTTPREEIWATIAKR